MEDTPDKQIIEALKKENFRMKVQVVSLENELSKYQGNEQVVSNEIMGQIQGELDKRDALLRKSKETITALQNENRALSVDYEAEFEKNSFLMEENKKLSKKISEDVARFNADIQQLTTELSNAKTELAESIARNAEIQKLTDENIEIKKKNDETLAQFSEAKNLLYAVFVTVGINGIKNFSDIDKVLTSPESFDVTEFVKNLNDLKNRNASFDQKLATAQMDNERMANEIEKLKQELMALDEAYSKKKSEVADLQKINEELESSLNDKTIELQQKVDIVNKKIEQVESLQKTVTEIQSKMDSKNSKSELVIPYSENSNNNNNKTNDLTELKTLTPSILNEMNGSLLNNTKAIAEATTLGGEQRQVLIEKSIKVSGNIITESEILRRENLLKQSLEHRELLKRYVKQYKEKVSRLQDKIIDSKQREKTLEATIKDQEKRIFELTTNKKIDDKNKKPEILMETIHKVNNENTDVDFKKQVDSLLQLLKMKTKVIIDLLNESLKSNSSPFITIIVSQIMGLTSEIEKFYQNVF